MSDRRGGASGRRAALLLAAAALTVAALGGRVLANPPVHDERRLVTISSGAVGGVYLPAAGALCRLLNQQIEQHQFRCAVEVTDGSLQNLNELLADETDFGLVQTDVQADAVLGRGRFAGEGAQAKLRSLFALHAEPVTLVSRIDSGIERFEDLRGKRLSIGELQSGTQSTMAMLLEAFGLAGSELARLENMNPQSAAAALCENRLDAFAYVVGHPNQLVRSASESCAVRIVELSGPVIERVLQAHPYITRARIPANLYVGHEVATNTIGVRASLLSTDRLSDDAAYAITRAVFQNLPALRALHPAFSQLAAPEMLSGSTAPLHPGARRYLLEAGLAPGPP
ncbi:MAG: TAXI family TRAP transporter solute-binding subunit [Burkholderiaceae bacterium]